MMLYKSSHLDMYEYTNVDWDRYINDRILTSGYCMMLGGNLVS